MWKKVVSFGLQPSQVGSVAVPLTRTATLDTLLHLQTFSLCVFLFKKYSFIYLAALGLSYGMRETHCGSQAQQLWSVGYLVAAHGFLIMVLLLLLSTDSRHMSSVVAAHKL